MTNTDTIYEIRILRDVVAQHIEELLAKAGRANSPEVDKEVAYALQHIAYQVHDSLLAVSPARSPRTAKTAAV
jgi:hypothetical protein